MVTFSDVLLNDDGSPRSGATVTIKAASLLATNPNPVLGTVFTNAQGRWTVGAGDGQQYDIFVQDGQQQIQYRGLSSIPHSFNDGQIAAGANIALTKLNPGSPVDIGDPAVYSATTWDGRFNQLIGLIGRLKTGANSDWLNAPVATITQIWGKFHDATGHKHTGGANDSPQVPHAYLLNAGALTHAQVDAHRHLGGAGEAALIPTAGLALKSVIQVLVKVGIAANPTTASGADLAIPEMSYTFNKDEAASDLLVFFYGSFSLDTAGVQYRLGVSCDGAFVYKALPHQTTANYQNTHAFCHSWPGIAAGPHTIEVRHSVGGGVLTNNGTMRTMVILEVKR